MLGKSKAGMKDPKFQKAATNTRAKADKVKVRKAGMTAGERMDRNTRARNKMSKAY